MAGNNKAGVPVAQNRSSPTSAANTITESAFFFDDDLVVLQAENYLFKINRHFLRRDSEVFDGMFSHPPSNSLEGLSKEHPIFLPDVTKQEMEALLKFYYFGYLSMYRDYIQNGAGELGALLSISTRFMFQKIRDMVIQEIEKDTKYTSISAVDRVVLAKKCDVPQWLEPAYMVIASRASPLEPEEGEKLGWDLTLKLCKVRERHRDEWIQSRCAHSFPPDKLFYWCNYCSAKLLIPSSIAFGAAISCSVCKKGINPVCTQKSLVAEEEGEKRERLARILQDVFDVQVDVIP